MPAMNVAKVYPGAPSAPTLQVIGYIPAGLDAGASVVHAAVPETTAEVSPPTKPVIVYSSSGLVGPISLAWFHAVPVGCGQRGATHSPSPANPPGRVESSTSALKSADR